MREVTLHSSPDSMGGAKRFPNTRVPVSLFFLNLAEGVGIDRFCGYPRVDPDDCRRGLAAAQEYIEGRDEPPTETEHDVEGMDPYGNKGGGRPVVNRGTGGESWRL